MAAPTYTIRQAVQSDVPTILALIQELAEYEHAAHEVQATEQKLLDTLSFDDKQTPGFAKTILICDATAANNAVAGMALYFHNYSTWTAAPGIYLEDLFVRPRYRGRGFGSALLRHLAGETLRAGGRRLEWSVLKWNKPSIDFYEGKTVGAKMMDEWVGMRVDGDGLRKLAEGES